MTKKLLSFWAMMGFVALSFIAKADLTFACKLNAKFDFKVNKCSVTFSDLSETGTGTKITSWYWDFGDGTTSTIKNPTHVYNGSGTYMVYLTITGVNAAGKKCTDKICNSVKVKDCKPAEPCKVDAKFKFNIDNCKVRFTNCSETCEGTKITSWLWDFGDGTTSTLENPTHSYLTSGTYLVCLTVEAVNKAGVKCKDKVCNSIKIKNCDPVKPCLVDAGFNFRINTCQVSFSDLSTTTTGSTITSWSWNFGDGTTSTLQNPSHVYTTSGTHNVCLIIAGRSAVGQVCKDTICRPVTVQGCEPCLVSAQFDFRIDTCQVSFSDLSTATTGSTITSWQWDFGDGTTSTTQNPSHTYTTSGTHNVCLIITGLNAIGETCRDTICRPVTVQGCEPCLVSARFDFRIDTCQVSFSDLSTATTGSTITSWQWDFGDGTTSTTQNPSHTYTTSGTHNVCLIITGLNAIGETCRDTVCRPVTVQGCEPCLVSARFDFRIDTCQVSFTDLSTATTGSTITSWQWDFGDGTTSTTQNPSHTYTTSGTHNVCLIITGLNAIGETCRDTVCRPVTVQGCEPCLVSARFDFRIDTCQVSFTDLSTTTTGSTITSWQWNFGDGTTSTVQNPSHVYTTSGTHNVCLIITGLNAIGETCRDTVCRPVTVQGCEPCLVSARFDFRIDTCQVSFTDLSTTTTGSTITSWQWNFGDGTTSTVQNPSHVYTTSGTHNVCLIITGLNAIGETCRDTVCRPVTVQGCEPCLVSARFDFRVNTCQVSFTDLSTTTTGSTITSWQWDFGDGTTSTTQNPSHIYTTSGIHNVCLIITGLNAIGETCRDTICRPVTVQGCEPCLVSARFDFIMEACTISFTDLSTTTTGSTITSWQWDFGDGTTSTTQNPSHNYTTSGIHNVCLIITGLNAIGETCRDTICRPVTVQGCEPCLVSARFDFIMEACTISFTDLSTTTTGSTITSWQWDFGDGTTSTTQNPSHIYTTSGIHNVCLIITGLNAIGETCRDTVCRPVTVQGCEPCLVSARFDFIMEACTISFTDLSTTTTGSTITSWQWDFGDGTTSTTQNPSHIYTTSGIHNVCLIITGLNAIGETCRDTICRPVTVQGCEPCLVTAGFDFRTVTCRVSFTDLSTTSTGSTITSWNWNFGDGTTSTVQNPSHVYTTSGTHNVCLIITGRNPIGETCRDTVCRTVAVQGCEPCLVTAGFNFRIQACQVSFSDLSSTSTGSTITSWQWNFGDGTTSTVQNPSHVYTTSGTHNVCLIITGLNAIGETCRDTVCRPVTAQGCDPCLVSAQFDLRIDTCQVSFTDLSSTGTGSTLTSWHWDFGDGSTSTVQNPVHVYTTSGTHNVCLRITGVNAIGETCRDTICLSIIVEGCEPIPCLVAAGFDFKIDLCSVSYTDLSSTSTGTTITSWRWDFGDGSASTVQNPVHVYTTSGTHTVCLIITGVNKTGEVCRDTVCRLVTLEGCDPIIPCEIAPKFDFAVDSCRVDFTDASGMGTFTTITSWNWDFGDGTSSTLQNPTHLYSLTDDYTVCLTIVGRNTINEECTDVVCSSVTVDCGRGFSDHVNSSTLKVYPNPAKDVVSINFKMAKEGQATIVVSDMQGRQLFIVKEGHFGKGVQNLNWNVGVPTGWYIVTVATDAAIEHKQLYIQK